MKRAKHGISLYLNGIVDTSKAGVYKLEESGVTYELTFVQFNQLKASKKIIEEWYNTLSRFEKKEVKRYGEIEQSDTGFYPDE